MKTLISFIRFYALTALFISVAAFAVSLFLYVFRSTGEYTLMKMLNLSLFNGLLNGVILGFIATLFITGAYYYNAAKNRCASI